MASNEGASNVTPFAQANHSATCRTRFEEIFIDAGSDNRVERAPVRRHEDQGAAEGRFAAGPADDEVIMQDARFDDGDQNVEAASDNLPPPRSRGLASTDDDNAPAVGRQWQRQSPSARAVHVSNAGTGTRTARVR